MSRSAPGDQTDTGKLHARGQPRQLDLGEIRSIDGKTIVRIIVDRSTGVTGRRFDSGQRELDRAHSQRRLDRDKVMNLAMRTAGHAYLRVYAMGDDAMREAASQAMVYEDRIVVDAVVIRNMTCRDAGTLATGYRSWVAGGIGFDRLRRGLRSLMIHFGIDRDLVESLTKGESVVTNTPVDSGELGQ